MNDLIEALRIFEKYCKGDVIHCEHDVMFVLIEPEIVSEEDIQKLNEFGFFADYLDRSFTSYRFGSC